MSDVRSRGRLMLLALAAACAILATYLALRSGRPRPGSTESPKSDLTTTEPIGSPAAPKGPPLPGHWVLTFDDEFDGDALKQVWTPHQYWSDGATIGEGDEQSDPLNVAISDGTLRLTARKDNHFGPPYSGALVQAGGIRGRSLPTFSFCHGYAEARVRIPAERGLWPAFWLMPSSYQDANGEIDIMDNGTGDPTVLHAGVIVDRRQSQHQYPTRLSTGFHTFAVEWKPDRIAWFVDGKQWATTTDVNLIPTEAMYPIFDLAVGGKWGGPPDTSTRFPAVMEVDWIRIWQKR